MWVVSKRYNVDAAIPSATLVLAPNNAPQMILCLANSQRGKLCLFISASRLDPFKVVPRSLLGGWRSLAVLWVLISD